MTKAEAIKWFQDSIDVYTIFPIENDIKLETSIMAVEALEKQIPKKPIHIHEVYHNHDWKCDENGEIDMWALSVGYCNGPMCNRCHASVCEHCNPEWNEEECVIDERRCPSCSEEVHYYYDTDKFCRNCGQALDWSEMV